MDPLFLYLTLFGGAVLVCAVAVFMHQPDVRACPGCGTDTPIHGQRCRHCGYRT
jgi:predicted amidophosphoribosyltransferase